MRRKQDVKIRFRQLLTPHALYETLRRGQAKGSGFTGLFRNQLDPGLVDEIRTATNGNYVLGTERFRDEVERILGRRVTTGKAGRPAKREPAQAGTKLFRARGVQSNSARSEPPIRSNSERRRLRGGGP